MDLSNDLISKFVKITNDNNSKTSKESTVYGTTVEYEGQMYVKIDGSDLLTPVETTADMQPGERVTVMIKDHSATVTGNITSPSASSTTVKKVTQDVEEMGNQISEFEIVIADKVSTKELDAEVARIDDLLVGKATIEELYAVNAEIGKLQTKDADIENLVADKASIKDLEVTNAEIDNLQANKASITDLEAVNAEIEKLQTKDADIENLVADKASIKDLEVTFATIEQLNATNANITILDTEVADIQTLVNGNLTSDNIASLNLTSANTTIQNAMIKNAMIDSVSASKLMAGTIDTNKITIQSSDGSMALTGSIQQFKDKNGKVRIQIGKDSGGNFTFVLYDETGKGILIDEGGIKSSNAIADGLIVDAKVAGNANISGSKLDIASVITEVNNDNSTTIKSNKIYLDKQGQSLEVAFNSLKTQVETIQDVTIDGDLTSVINQVQSNTTQINANKEGISTLVSENTIRKEEISNLDGEIQEVNTTLSNKYTSLQQDLDGFETTVGQTYATKSSVTDLSNNLSNNYSTTTAMNSAINQKANEITSSVSQTYATKGSVSDLNDDLSDLSNNLSNNYSTTTAMNSAINQKANEITSSVSQTYATKDSVNKTYATKSELSQTSTDLTATFNAGYEQGIVGMNKDGIKVTHSNISGYTQMKADGFYVNNGSQNVISCTSDGLVVRGTVYATDGTFTGTITSSTIKSSDGSFTVDPNGNISGASFASSKGGNFSIDEDGEITAAKLSVEGSVSTQTLVCNNILNKAYPKTLVNTITLYVTENGNDSNECVDGAEFYTLQGAINSVPKFMNGKAVYIQLEKDCVENVTISFFTAGRLGIYFNWHTLCGYLYAYGCSALIAITGGNVNSYDASRGAIHPSVGRDMSDHTTSIGFDYCHYVSIYYMDIYGSDNQASGLTGYKTGLAAQLGTVLVFIHNCAIKNCGVGFRAVSGSHIHVVGSSGIASSFGFAAYTGGKISLASSPQAGGAVIPYDYSSGGQIWFSNATFESGSASTDNSSATTTTTTKTATYTASTAQAIQYYGASNAKWRTDCKPKVGTWGYGPHTAWWFFGDDFENMASKNVTKITITFTRNRGGNGSAVTHYFYTHNYTVQPSTAAPSYYTTRIGSASVATDSSATITITDSTLINKIKSYKGICSIPPSQSTTYYSVMDAVMTVTFTYVE